ncbi:hypothetical protein [Ruegeria lacuscaerulensis]|uniref:hypothetical protein n=1 Tax=Ruegeria lacuscaerulensis TaxID=55218 RepID=UPI00147FE2A7|nr:hypothetical protein [Ruegeria lacuscaerulensis]
MPVIPNTDNLNLEMTRNKRAITVDITNSDNEEVFWVVLNEAAVDDFTELLMDVARIVNKRRGTKCQIDIYAALLAEYRGLTAQT